MTQPLICRACRGLPSQWHHVASPQHYQRPNIHNSLAYFHALARRFAQKLLSFTDVFTLQQQAANANASQPLTLTPQHSTQDQRTQAVAAVLSELRDKHGLLSGWRDELYPVTPAFDAKPLLLMERAAAPYFGIRAYGVHINGYVVQPDGSKALWVARRSKSKQTWPGKLDHIVAGGQVRFLLYRVYAGVGGFRHMLKQQRRVCLSICIMMADQQAA